LTQGRGAIDNSKTFFEIYILHFRIALRAAPAELILLHPKEASGAFGVACNEEDPVKLDLNGKQNTKKRKICKFLDGKKNGEKLNLEEKE